MGEGGSYKLNYMIVLYKLYNFIKYQTLDIEFLLVDLIGFLLTVKILYPVICPNMETVKFVTENFPSNWPKTQVGRK